MQIVFFSKKIPLWAYALFILSGLSFSLFSCGSEGEVDGNAHHPDPRVFDQIAMGGGKTGAPCIYVGNELKCWGYNSTGVLGRGNRDNYGDDLAETYNAITPIDLGDSSNIVFLSGYTRNAGRSTSCAIYESHSGGKKLKCWGSNDFGKLGLGARSHRGDHPDEMGNQLPHVELGTGVVPKQVGVGNAHTCALTTEGGVKCWGYAGTGRLGLAQTTHVGESQEHMGDNLQYAELGTDAEGNRLAWEALAVGGMHGCVVSEDRRFKCWGNNNYGQLGYGNTNNRGDSASEMGNNLPYVEIGTDEKGQEERVKQMALGHYFSCVLTQSNKVKCWGSNSYAQLGLSHTNHIGNQQDEMGDNLEAVNLGTEEGIYILRTGPYSVCVVFVSGKLKCWGSNEDSHLGTGFNSSAIGDNVAEMGDNLPFIHLGTGAVVLDVFPYTQSTCALLSTGKMKCWGKGENGNLLNQSTDIIGNYLSEMGDNLPYIEGLEFTQEQLQAKGY